MLMVKRRADGVDTTLLMNVFINGRSAVGVIVSLLYLILLPPTVRRIQCGSSLSGQ